jgi:hypothetical protein
LAEGQTEKPPVAMAKPVEMKQYQLLPVDAEFCARVVIRGRKITSSCHAISTAIGASRVTLSLLVDEIILISPTGYYQRELCQLRLGPRPFQNAGNLPDRRGEDGLSSIATLLP